MNVDLVPGSCVVVETGQGHELANTGEDDLVVTYFGVAPDRGRTEPSRKGLTRP